MDTICLNLIEMIQYVCNFLTKPERQKIEKHLSECDACLDEITSLFEIMHHPDLKEWELWKPVSRLKRIIEKISKRWAIQQPPEWTIRKTAFELSPIPIPIPIRKNLKRRTKNKLFESVEVQTNFDEYNVKLYVERSGHDEASLKILVQQNEKLSQHLNVFIKKENISCPWAKQQSDNYVSFENIPFGIFQMTLKNDYETVGTYRFSIDAKGVKTDV